MRKSYQQGDFRSVHPLSTKPVTITVGGRRTEVWLQEIPRWPIDYVSEFPDRSDGVTVNARAVTAHGTGQDVKLFEVRRATGMVSNWKGEHSKTKQLRLASAIISRINRRLSTQPRKAAA